MRLDTCAYGYAVFSDVDKEAFVADLRNLEDAQALHA